MNIQVISDPSKIDHQKWNEFVINHPQGNIFQTPGMYEVYLKTKNYEPIVVAVTNYNEINGIILGVIQKEYAGFFGKFTSRSIIFGGPLLADNQIESLTLLLQEYNANTSEKVIYSQIRNLFSQSDKSIEFNKNGFIFTDHLNIILNLNVGADQIWSGFSRSRKKGIKKAISNNFKFENGINIEYLDAFYDLLTTNYKRIKLPIPEKNHFIHLLNTYGNNNSRIFIIRQNDIIVTALFALIYKNTMYGYYMGSTNDKEVIKKKPVDLLFWEVFKWAINSNIMYFDWMGAGKPTEPYGVRDYKIQFGGDVVNFGRFEKINKPLFYKMAKAGLTLWQKLG